MTEIEQLRAKCAELEAEISTDAISRGTLRAELLEKCDRIAELEARLEELGKQEPVYWGHYDLDMVDNAESADFNVPLYTHAPDSAARIKELEAENAELKQRQQWQPIETAPKDGRWIVVTSTHIKYFRVAVQFEYGAWFDVNGINNDDTMRDAATHWMPLPDAPAIDAAKGGAM